MVDANEFNERFSFYDQEDLEITQINKMADLKNSDILEIGCGTGRVTFKLEGYKKLTAIDKEEVLIEYCRKKNKSGKIEFIKSDAGSMPFGDASFDVVIATWGIASSKDMGSVLWDVSRVLRPNGAFLIIDESSLGDYEELKERFCPGYRKMIRMNNLELRRQLSRFFTKIDQQNLTIPDIYPDMNTALKIFTFDLKICTKKCNINQEEERKELEKFAKSGKVIINRGVMVLKATG